MNIFFIDKTYAVLFSYQNLKMFHGWGMTDIDNFRTPSKISESPRLKVFVKHWTTPKIWYFVKIIFTKISF